MIHKNHMSWYVPRSWRRMKINDIIAVLARVITSVFELLEEFGGNGPPLCKDTKYPTNYQTISWVFLLS